MRLLIGVGETCAEVATSTALCDSLGRRRLGRLAGMLAYRSKAMAKDAAKAAIQGFGEFLITFRAR